MNKQNKEIFFLIGIFVGITLLLTYGIYKYSGYLNLNIILLIFALMMLFACLCYILGIAIKSKLKKSPTRKMSEKNYYKKEFKQYQIGFYISGFAGFSIGLILIILEKDLKLLVIMLLMTSTWCLINMRILNGVELIEQDKK